jgi:hypothetical protein
MARAKGQHSIDIPDYLWEALDEAAAFHNIPTSRMIAQWLWEHAKRHASSSRVTPELAKRLSSLPRPYDRDMGGTREYSRPIASTDRHP